MKNKTTYFTKFIYTIYMGIVMGFIFTSIFLVIITNIDKYFFDSFIGIRGDWLYYVGTFLFIPIFGFVYIYNLRIIIEKNKLIIREKPFSFITSNIDISTIKSISLHRHEGRRIIKRGIIFENEETEFIVMTTPFSDETISLLLNKISIINPLIEIDDYYKKVLNN